MSLKPLTVIAILCALLFAPAMQAQNPSQETEEQPVAPQSIVEIIEATSGNSIEIEIPAEAMPYVLPSPKKEERETLKEQQPSRSSISSTGPRKTNGFRIQIFSDGRNQSTLQARARQRTNAVLSRFPQYKLQVYSFSKAPNWYTHIGNFRTQREASAALQQLRRAFPKFAGEMRVVKSQIVVLD